MRSRIAAGAAALALVAAFGTTIATQATTAASRRTSGSVVHLTWWTMWSGASLKPVDELVAQFNKTHPGIKVTETNIPSVATTSTAKLLSSIAAGDPPDVFTEWWPEIGSFAANGDLTSFNQYLTGPLAGFKKYLYPVAVQGGTYKGQLVAAPMSLNSWALYYNKALLAKYGITSPPKTLAQLDADQAKMWVTSNGQLSQIGFYPDTNENGFQFYTSFFGDTNCINAAGKYDYASASACPGGIAEMNWIKSYAKYSYSQVQALQTAEGQVAGGAGDIWSNGKAGFVLSGPWEGAQDVPATNAALAGHFGVEPFPGVPSTIGQGNFVIVPKGTRHPQQAIEFIAWLSGYDNAAFAAKIDTAGGWIPGGPSVTKQPVYQKWIAANPWLKGFLPEMTDKGTVAPTLTATQSQLFTAEDSATANVLQGTMTPLQALQYIDTQGNG